MDSSPPCDKQRHARDENRERQQRRQTVCASGRGHPHGVPRAMMDRPSGYSSPMDPTTTPAHLERARASSPDALPCGSGLLRFLLCGTFGGSVRTAGWSHAPCVMT